MASTSIGAATTSTCFATTRTARSLIREAKMWQAAQDDCKTCGACAYVSYLKAAFHAPEIPVVVVELGYRSDRDTCGEPSDQQHVVTW